jgi:prephenate dehydratase
MNGFPIQITEFQPVGSLRVAENKKLKILKSAIEEKPEQVTHELALRFLTLSARKNSKFQNEKELKKDLEQIIKLCIDWHTKYKEEEKL